MRHVLCEGRNDMVFLSKLLGPEGDRRVLAIDSDLQKFLFTFTKPFYATAYRAAILGDRGRDVLVSSYVPHLVRDLFGKVRSADLTIVTDDDNSSHDELFGAYSQTITSSLLSRGMADTTIDTDPSARTFRVISSRDPSFRISLSFVWVPISLEMQVRDGALRRYQHRFSQTRRETIRALGPHRALNVIALDLSCSTDDLFRMSVEDGWFEQEDWFLDCRSCLNEPDVSIEPAGG